MNKIQLLGKYPVSVVELADKFVISYLEAPVEAPNEVMASWVASLRKG
jgi:hypothetical protein